MGELGVGELAWREVHRDLQLAASPHRLPPAARLAQHALAGLGQIHMRLERHEEALGWFRRALEANPNLLGVEFEIKGIERRLAEQRGKST